MQCGKYSVKNTILQLHCDRCYVTNAMLKRGLNTCESEANSMNTHKDNKGQII